MMQRSYIMESEEESLRLDLKTDPKALREQAAWAGIQPGMRVADLGCGPGKTAYLLTKLVQPGGSAVGVDISKRRIAYAQSHYQDERLEFLLEDIRKPLDHLGLFDFVWVRFVLEHYRKGSFAIVKNISSILEPGGILCLIDLDYNCLSHFGLSSNLEKALFGVMNRLEEGANFDPYAGRKLYAYLYDLGYKEINVHLDMHHLIFGKLSDADQYNWRKKVEIAAKNSGYPFAEFENGFEGFKQEFSRFFSDPRRFTYTPIMIARGRKP